MPVPANAEKTAPPIGSYILASKIFPWKELEIKLVVGSSLQEICEVIKFTFGTLFTINRTSSNSLELWSSIFCLPSPKEGSQCQIGHLKDHDILAWILPPFNCHLYSSFSDLKWGINVRMRYKHWSLFSPQSICKQFSCHCPNYFFFHQAMYFLFIQLKLWRKVSTLFNILVTFLVASLLTHFIKWELSMQLWIYLDWCGMQLIFHSTQRL